jgi:RNA polymerase sigma-70 factor (ECF subfamily)
MRHSRQARDGLDDGELVALYRKGSADAGEILVRRHWPRAWRTAYAVLASRAEAEDAAQTAVERAFTQIARFDTDRPFGPWLARIAANQALNVLRARRREAPLSGEEPGSDIYAGGR